MQTFIMARRFSGSFLSAKKQHTSEPSRVSFIDGIPEPDTTEINLGIFSLLHHRRGGLLF